MESLQLTEEDHKQIREHGIREEQLQSQVALLKKDESFLTLERPCTLGDGIIAIPDDDIQNLPARQNHAAQEGRFIKFVPASGAATRMFKVLVAYLQDNSDVTREQVVHRADNGDEDAKAVRYFFDNLTSFAFYDELSELMKRDNLDPDRLREQGAVAPFLHYLLTDRGLGYADLPKGLLSFHRYPEAARTPLEEHLVEAAHYVQDLSRTCRLHMTISPEHEAAFNRLVEEKMPAYEESFGVTYDLSFSFQKPSTDTIALDMDNRLFRNDDGSLLFRPGGHGALIENLNDLNGDLIYIKNIDNVVPDRLKAETVRWKKILGGYLIRIQERIFQYLRQVEYDDPGDEMLEEALAFARESLHLTTPFDVSLATRQQKIDVLVQRLNRPLRVCGVVKNVGEPGGGPFWVRDADGSFSVQIVESAQVDMDDRHQYDIWHAATHFNPVDIVCGVRDAQGNPFDLSQSVNRDAVFISRKSKEGRELKALELPGLWNGGMAYWNTVFVEVPGITFNPVKTVNDLLRNEHQPA